MWLSERKRVRDRGINVELLPKTVREQRSDLTRNHEFALASRFRYALPRALGTEMKALLKTPYPIGAAICAALGGAIGMGILLTILAFPAGLGVLAVMSGGAFTYWRCRNDLKRLNLPLSTSLDEYQAIIRKPNRAHRT
jgi:hypothetical protein